MRILDRYISREFIKTFLLIMVSLVALYLIVDFFERLRMFLSRDATVLQVVSYFFFTIPMIVTQMLPVSFLLAALITFAILSKNSEITAIRANGISLFRLSLPVIVLSIAACFLSFVLSEFITPAANERAKYIKLVEVQKKKKLGSFTQNEIWYRGDDGIYNFAVYDPEKAMLKGVRIYYLDQNMHLARRIDARKARWEAGRWIFDDVMITTFPEEPGSFPRIERYSTTEIDLPEQPSDFLIVQKDTDEMGFFELRSYIRKIRSEGYDATRYITDMHGKIAFALVNVILGVLGISFSLRTERSGGIARSIGTGIIIGFSYWIVFAFAVSLGRSGSLPPLLAAWAANLILGLVAVVSFMRVRT
ncbi:MAG: LPS export ABC transporter permease LptG [Deltaproteobacteria bacterium]|nr:LPS export ABC transporter permease LptG [Deltaproteobacteria bacterium]